MFPMQCPNDPLELLQAVVRVGAESSPLPKVLPLLSIDARKPKPPEPDEVFSTDPPTQWLQGRVPEEDLFQ